MTAQVIGDADFVREWFAFFGPTTGVRTLGWCTATMLKLAGAAATETDLRTRGWGDRSTRYRNVERLVSFRDHLVSKGYALGPDASASAPGQTLLALEGVSQGRLWTA